MKTTTIINFLLHIAFYIILTKSLGTIFSIEWWLLVGIFLLNGVNMNIEGINEENERINGKTGKID